MSLLTSESSFSVQGFFPWLTNSDFGQEYNRELKNMYTSWTSVAFFNGLKLLLAMHVNSLVSFLFKGYFQLKAYPGAWNLQLREGKSSKIYDIER